MARPGGHRRTAAVLRHRPLDADSIVLIDGTVAEVTRDQAIVERVMREVSAEVRVAEDEQARAALWYGRLHAPDSVVQSGKGFFIGDVTVPRDRIPEMPEAIQATVARHADGLLFIAVCGSRTRRRPAPHHVLRQGQPARGLRPGRGKQRDHRRHRRIGRTHHGEHGVGTEKIRS
jgi:glycolate oxidase